MPTLKYKDGSEWKELEISGNGGATETPTSFAGVTPSILKKWSKDCVKNPEKYVGLLGQPIQIDYADTSQKVFSNHLWTLVGLNHYTKYGTNETVGFVFMLNQYMSSIAGSLSSTITVSPSMGWTTSMSPARYDNTTLYKTTVDTYIKYIGQTWLDIIEEVNLPCAGYTQYTTSSNSQKISNATINSKKIFPPSLGELTQTTGVTADRDNTDIKQFALFAIGNPPNTLSGISNPIWTRSLSCGNGNTNDGWRLAYINSSGGNNYWQPSTQTSPSSARFSPCFCI